MSKWALASMETIRITTMIAAPVDRCFKLSTSVDLHLAAAHMTRDAVMEGATKGLLRQGETVKWRERHFGFNFTQKRCLEALRPYTYFRDVMVDGAFAVFQHEHYFAPMNDGTRMRDELRFAAPMGLLGRIAEKFLLRNYLKKFLQRRNALLKQVAESEEWRKYLGEEPKDRVSKS
jgi:ligand-binding SRPBCC domain-containing protein